MTNTFLNGATGFCAREGSDHVFLICVVVAQDTIIKDKPKTRNIF